MAADNLQVLNPAVAGAGLTYALADVLQPGFTAAVRLLRQMS